MRFDDQVYGQLKKSFFLDKDNGGVLLLAYPAVYAVHLWCLQVESVFLRAHYSKEIPDSLKLHLDYIDHLLDAFYFEILENSDSMTPTWRSAVLTPYLQRRIHHINEEIAHHPYQWVQEYWKAKKGVVIPYAALQDSHWLALYTEEDILSPPFRSGTCSSISQICAKIYAAWRWWLKMEPSACWFITIARIGDLDGGEYDQDDFEDYEQYLRDWQENNADEVPPSDIDIKTWPEPELLDQDWESHVCTVSHSSVLNGLPIDHVSWQRWSSQEELAATNFPPRNLLRLGKLPPEAEREFFNRDYEEEADNETDAPVPEIAQQSPPLAENSTLFDYLFDSSGGAPVELPSFGCGSSMVGGGVFYLFPRSSLIRCL
jgi:hypothetical protein